MGGRDSLAPGERAVHLGADDNASGTAALLEVGAHPVPSKTPLRRDVVFVAFSGEEMGVLGSTWFVKHPPPGVAPSDIVAMLNMDMVGRLRDNALQVFGTETATAVARPPRPRLRRRARRLRARLAAAASGRATTRPSTARGSRCSTSSRACTPTTTSRATRPDKLNAAGMAQTRAIVASLATRSRRAATGSSTTSVVASPPPRRGRAQLRLVARDGARLRRSAEGTEGDAPRRRAPGRRGGQGRAEARRHPREARRARRRGRSRT